MLTWCREIQIKLQLPLSLGVVIRSTAISKLFQRMQLFNVMYATHVLPRPSFAICFQTPQAVFINQARPAVLSHVLLVTLLRENSLYLNVGSICFKMIVGLAEEIVITHKVYSSFVIRTLIANCTDQPAGNISYGGANFFGRIFCCSTDYCNNKCKLIVV